MKAFPLTGAALAFLLVGCQTSTKNTPAPTVVAEEIAVAEWQKVATAADQSRIERVDGAWALALADARKGGFARQLGAEGALLDPKAALPRAAPPPGSYRCRIIKIGAPAARRGRGFEAFKPFFCFVGVDDTERLSITKQTGSQRPGGYLYDTENTRQMIFLGSTALGDEDVPKAYGEDSRRDMAGVFERYGDFRYRLVVPWPQGDEKLHVFEFIPVPEQ